MQSFPYYQHPAPEGTFVKTDELVWVCNLPKSTVHVQVTGGVTHTVGLDKCIMRGVHPHGITQSSFAALNTLVLHLFLPPPTQPPCCPHCSFSRMCCRGTPTAFSAAWLLPLSHVPTTPTLSGAKQQPFDEACQSLGQCGRWPPSCLVCRCPAGV